MRTYKWEKIDTLIPNKVFCDFCKKEFDKVDIEYESYGKMNINFGYGSNYDSIFTGGFKFEICDDCFEKYIKSKIKTKINTFIYKIKKLFED